MLTMWHRSSGLEAVSMPFPKVASACKTPAAESVELTWLRAMLDVTVRMRARTLTADGEEG